MIEVDKVSFTYRTAKTPAIKELSLTVKQGEFLGIIGPSGAGKSTLLSCMNGAVPHYFNGDFYGSVTVGGSDTFEASLTDLSKTVATVFQDVDASMVSSVVEDEILYALENFGVSHDEIPERVAGVLADLGITDLRHAEISALSGGQKQKVALAAVLALRPSVLLLDEPTGALDPVASRQVFDLLAHLNRDKGITVVVVEQKIGLLTTHADRLAVMEAGSLALCGPTREVLRRSDDLKRIGVNVPRVADLSLALASDGFTDGRMCLDVAEAVSMMKDVVA